VSVDWYLIRATGVVTLLLLTTAFALGIATSSRWKPAGSRMHVTTTIHRNASLLAVVFLALHVLTSLVDPDAQVGVVASVVPFGSSLSLAVGVLSLDLLAAIVLTSLGRRRLGYHAWRLVHWSAYAAWPLAVGHGLGMGTDVRTWWLQAVTVGCLAAMGGALTYRLTPTVSR
jgi:methionine sulfoxide reductase heme-binding subunit